MRKRAGLARALALDPEILFLDEPTAGLDPIGAADFDQLIRDLKTSLGLTVFIVTHDLDTLFAICDRVAVLVDNKIRVGTLEAASEGQPPLDPRLFPRSARSGGPPRRSPIGKSPMETRAHYVAVGAFVLTMVVLAFAAVLWLARGATEYAIRAVRHLFHRPGQRPQQRRAGRVQRRPGRPVSDGPDRPDQCRADPGHRRDRPDRRDQGRRRRQR